MRLITWNLNARRRWLSEQIAALTASNPDIVALQEVTSSSGETLGLELPRIALPHLLASFVVGPPWEAVGLRRYGLLARL